MSYKILSLDGGGSWAVIEVKALIALYGEDATGHEVLSGFDMAVANSGGSIVLGGLLENKTLSTILDYFMDSTLRGSLFQPTDDPIDVVLSGLLHFGPRFSTAKKLPALQRLLPLSGGQTMDKVATAILAANGQKPVHILITGFDYDRNLAAFFRSAPVGGAAWGVGEASTDVTLAQAIHASSNPPVQFFDAATTFGAERYWDGAIAAYNNPVLAGVAEAITLDIDPMDIRALSVGTASVRYLGPPLDNPPPLHMARSGGGFVSDLTKLAGSITDDPPDSATFLAHVMTHGAAGLAGGLQSRVVRMNPLISPQPDGAGGYKAPGNWTIEQLTHLAGIDLAALQQIDLNYIADYADLWIMGDAPNQPIRMHADDLILELGDPTFPAAMTRWAAIK